MAQGAKRSRHQLIPFFSTNYFELVAVSILFPFFFSFLLSFSSHGYYNPTPTFFEHDPCLDQSLSAPNHYHFERRRLHPDHASKRFGVMQGHLLTPSCF